MQAQRIGSIGLSPLNQCGQTTVEKPLTIFTHSDLPVKHAFAGFAAGMDNLSALDTLGAQYMARSLDVIGAADKMDQTGLFGNGCLLYTSDAADDM
jgi:hypothetical protein